MSAANFYDDYLSYHIKSGINDRIYRLYKKLRRAGLRSNETILEIGCGIGALTYLLAKKIKKGRIEAFDPSPKSVAYAKQHIKQANVNFSVEEALNFSPAHAPYDKILLFDVLEHIPEEQHAQVFKKIANWLKDDGKMFINLPNPEYILYDQKYNPATLQELDQPVFLHKLLPVFEANQLALILFQAHSVWVKHDYHFFILQKKKEFTEQFLSKERNVVQKILIRLQRFYRQLRYPFPK